MVSFPSVSPPRPSSPIRVTCPAHLILLHFITRTILGEEYKSFSSSLCSLLHSAVTSSHLGPNILLNTTFSNTLSFLSSFNISDQVSHPHRTTGRIIVLYIRHTTPKGKCKYVTPYLHVFIKFTTITKGQPRFLNTSRPSVSSRVYSSTKLSVLYVPITGLNRTK